MMCPIAIFKTRRNDVVNVKGSSRSRVVGDPKPIFAWAVKTAKRKSFTLKLYASSSPLVWIFRQVGPDGILLENVHATRTHLKSSVSN
jgi:hypothetical protein